MINDDLAFLDEFPKEKNGLFIVYELFTFDNLFRLLLKAGMCHEEVMDMLIATCSFSAVVFQERIHDEKYFDLDAKDALPPELAASKAKFISDMLEIANAQR